MYADDESASKAARQLGSSSFGVKSISWRKESTLTGPITVLSFTVRSQDAVAVSSFVASKHADAEPEISVFSLGLKEERPAAVPAAVETRFTTPLNDRIVNEASADTLKRQVREEKKFFFVVC